MTLSLSYPFSPSNAEDIFRSFFGTSDPFAAQDGGDGGPFGGGGGSGGGGAGGFPFMMGGMGPGMRMNMGGMPGDKCLINDDATSLHSIILITHSCSHTLTPFSRILSPLSGGMPPPGMNGGGPRGQMAQATKTKAPLVNHTLFVTLEDLFTGTTKRMRITSKRVVDGSGTMQQIAAEKEIVVKPGWKNGTKITFENEGDEAPGVIPADIVFTLQTKPHDLFERDGDDLVHTCAVDLKDALGGVRHNEQPNHY